MKSNIRVKNIYYMLTYAFQALREKEYQNLATETFDHIDDLFAAILILGISGQIKRGLCREYKMRTEPLSVVRGKIDLAESLKSTLLVQRRLICQHDEFSENNLMNQILKTTLLHLNHSPNVSQQNCDKLRQLLRFFVQVTPLQYSDMSWNTFIGII